MRFPKVPNFWKFEWILPVLQSLIGWALCYKMVIWLTPSPKLFTSFMNVLKECLSILLTNPISNLEIVHFWKGRLDMTKMILQKVPQVFSLKKVILSKMPSQTLFIQSSIKFFKGQLFMLRRFFLNRIWVLYLFGMQKSFFCKSF